MWCQPTIADFERKNRAYPARRAPTTGATISVVRDPDITSFSPLAFVQVKAAG